MDAFTVVSGWKESLSSTLGWTENTSMWSSCEPARVVGDRSIPLDGSSGCDPHSAQLRSEWDARQKKRVDDDRNDVANNGTNGA